MLRFDLPRLDRHRFYVGQDVWVRQQDDRVCAGQHEVLARVALLSKGQSYPAATGLNVHRPCSVGIAARSINRCSAVLFSPSVGMRTTRPD